MLVLCFACYAEGMSTLEDSDAPVNDLLDRECITTLLILWHIAGFNGRCWHSLDDLL